jgi:hypothetical protein
MYCSIILRQSRLCDWLTRQNGVWYHRLERQA